MPKPILITGGAGSVGKQLTNMLLAEGQSVRVFDLPFMDFTDLETLENVEIVKGDVTDSNAVLEAIDGVHGVLHLAAILPPNSEKDRSRTFSVNVQGTQNIVDAIKKVSPEAIMVFTSSISTYGDTSSVESPVTIMHPQNAIDIYADSKIHGEKILIDPHTAVAVKSIDYLRNQLTQKGNIVVGIDMSGFISDKDQKIIDLVLKN